MYLNQQFRDFPSGSPLSWWPWPGPAAAEEPQADQGEPALRNHLPTLSWTGGEAGTFNGKGALYKPAGKRWGRSPCLARWPSPSREEARLKSLAGLPRGVQLWDLSEQGNLLPSLAGERRLQGGAIWEPQFHSLSCQRLLWGDKGKVLLCDI